MYIVLVYNVYNLFAGVKVCNFCSVSGDPLEIPQATNYKKNKNKFSHVLYPLFQ